MSRSQVQPHVVIFEGPGFSGQEEVVALLKARDHRVTRVSVLEDWPSGVDQADVYLLRGAWTPSLEERLWVQVLAEKLEPLLDRISQRWDAERTRGPRMIGIGRGALLLLCAKALGLSQFSKLEWHSTLMSAGTWVDVSARNTQLGRFPAGVLGRAKPEAAPGVLHADLEGWLSVNFEGSEEFLGLALKDKIFLSFVDLLAYQDGSQLPDFGYRDLTALPNASQILYSLVDGTL